MTLNEMIYYRKSCRQFAGKPIDAEAKAQGDNVRVLGVACIAVTVPVLAATIYFVFLKIGDTTHVDLNTVRGDEWDDQ